MIYNDNQFFVLNTANTTYAFRVVETGHLEHLYYGKKIKIRSTETDTLEQQLHGMVEKHVFAPGNTISYDGVNWKYSLEDMCLEMSALGRGDVREPFLEIGHADGSFTSDFTFVKAEVSKGKEEYETLPGSYDESGEVEHLCVTLEDKSYGLTLELHYYVYEACDVITRSAKLINSSEESIRLNRMMSMQIDFQTAGYEFTTFTGAWGREMNRHIVKAESGKLTNASYTGTSSNRANPFIMLSKEGCNEDMGECYGFNLIYSGNHYEAVEVSSFGKTRIVAGINPQSFCFVLAAGENFEAPEAVMSYSHDGFNGLSQHMHAFVREHIVRGEWKNKPRPVLLNSWEASYFDINERKLLSLAKAGKEVGVELFVMDDGWFGTRDDDTQALGDWQVNSKKLPNGIKGLVDKVRALGMEFGIWVEPEMVNVKSKLYEAHPQWVLEIPGKPHSEGRNQRILDLGNIEVQDYIIEEMSKVFGAGDIGYVKWDMNRIFTDYFAQSLPAEKQGEVTHRYYIGLYRCMKELTKRFPKILFEGCASGGNRFDLGILCYFPQIWASDDSDAIARAKIQNGYSYGYPLSTIGAHVSACPNHQTLRVTPLESRFNVASYGLLGYECNLCEMKAEDLAAIKEQIALYKQWREVFQYGNFYRGRSFDSGNITEWCCVAKDKKRAVGMLLQSLVTPNSHFDYFKAHGLDEDTKYHFYNRSLKINIKNFGGLVNMISPVHIKQDSLLHEVAAKLVKMNTEVEEHYLYGDSLMYSGVKLQPAFGGTGYNEQVRYFQDFESRMYFIEAE